MPSQEGKKAIPAYIFSILSYGWYAHVRDMYTGIDFNLMMQQPSHEKQTKL